MNSEPAWITLQVRTRRGSGSDTLVDGYRLDDGAVVYLNGTKVFASNMPSTFSYTTFASSQIESNTYYTSDIDVSRLAAGTNVIAVEVHQGSASSSDLSMDLELTAEVSGGGGTGGGAATGGRT